MKSRRFRVSSFILPCTIGFLCGCIAIGCAAQGRRHVPAGVEPCETLDSLYASSGFESPAAMTGKITFDVEQYRMRGQFTLVADPDGDMAFDFSNSTLFGKQHEDISMSIAGGVVRVLDRERGRYYEGREVDDLLGEMIGLEMDAGEMISLVLGRMPPCSDLQDKEFGISRNGETVFRSRTRGEDVRIVFDGEKRTVRSFEWPLALTGGAIVRLQADYTWEGGEGENPLLRRLVLSVPEKGWRIKLAAAN